RGRSGKMHYGPASGVGTSCRRFYLADGTGYLVYHCGKGTARLAAESIVERNKSVDDFPIQDYRANYRRYVLWTRARDTRDYRSGQINKLCDHWRATGREILLFISTAFDELAKKWFSHAVP